MLIVACRSRWSRAWFRWVPRRNHSNQIFKWRCTHYRSQIIQPILCPRGYSSRRLFTLAYAHVNESATYLCRPYFYAQEWVPTSGNYFAKNSPHLDFHKLLFLLIWGNGGISVIDCSKQQPIKTHSAAAQILQKHPSS